MKNFVIKTFQKKLTIIFISALFLLITPNGCNLNTNPLPEKSGNTFAIYFLKDNTLTMKDIQNKNLESLVLSDIPWLTQDDIEYYDWSSHCIYLKKDKRYFFPGYDSFGFESLSKLSWVDRPLILFANKRKCYACYFFSTIYSEFWPYPDIFDFDIIYYPRDVIYIEWPYPFAKDIRNDEEIKNTLSMQSLLHNGLHVSIDSLWIDNADTASIRYQITITNNDENNLYVLDPNKMGTSLFYAFTNGPVLYNSKNNTVYTSLNKKAIVPPFGVFQPEWFSRIERDKSINRTIVLKGYPHLPEGNYYCSFSFNNPYYIKKEERILADGKYWVGPTRSELISFDLVELNKINFQSIPLKRNKPINNITAPIKNNFE